MSVLVDLPESVVAVVAVTLVPVYAVVIPNPWSVVQQSMRDDLKMIAFMASANSLFVPLEKFMKVCLCLSVHMSVYEAIHLIFGIFTKCVFMSLFLIFIANIAYDYVVCR